MSGRFGLVVTLLVVVAVAACRDANVAGRDSGRPSGGPSVASSGTPPPLAPTPPRATATTLVAVTVRTPEPRAAAEAPSDPRLAPTPAVDGALDEKLVLPAPTPAVDGALDEKLVPPTPSPAPTRPAPTDPAERALWTVERAEADFDAGRYREALDRLDAGPVPADLDDLVALRLAELSLLLGDPSRARSELGQAALARSTNRIVLLRSAEAAEKAGLWAQAADFWVRASRQPTWSAERAAALNAAARAYARAGDPNAAAERLFQAGDPDGKNNRDPGLVAALKANDDLTAYHVALMALLQGNRVEAVQKLNRYLAVAPGGPYAQAARDRLKAIEASQSPPTPWTEARRADTAEAYAAFRQAYPEAPQAPEALFREGFARYQAGEVDAARRAWTAGAAPGQAADARARALYWLGKLDAEQGDDAVARERWTLAAALRPSSYYTIRAGDRLNGGPGWPAGGAAVPPGQPSPDEEAEALRWLDGWAGQAGPSASEQRSLGRAVELAGIGLERTAGAELDGLIETTSNPRTVYAAGRRASERGLWLSSARAGNRLARLSPEKAALDVPRAVRRLAYPTGYADLVQAESARRDVGPLLLLALIRQESLFDRYARSVSDARGLTQVMPATGAGLARAAGRASFDADELFDPVTSVDFGARFLAGQLVGFRGDVFRAVAAYNAGPGGANRWARGVADPDVYVESIEYPETREYVKAIYVHHAAYRSLVAP